MSVSLAIAAPLTRPPPRRQARTAGASCYRRGLCCDSPSPASSRPPRCPIRRPRSVGAPRPPAPTAPPCSTASRLASAARCDPASSRSPASSTSTPPPPLYRLRLRLRVGGHSEQRSLGAETCSALVDATAVLAALVVTNNPPPQRPQILAPLVPPPPIITPPPPEPPALETPPPPLPDEPEPERPDTPAPAIAPPPAAATFTTPAPPAPPRPTLGGFLRVHGGLELGALPRFTGAVGLAGGLLWRRARLELQTVWLPPRTGATGLGPVRANLIAGAAHGCARPGRGILEVPLCAGLELGAMRGSAPDGRSAANWWLAGVIGAGLAIHVHPRWTVWTALQSATAFIKPNFVAAGPGDPVTLFQSALTTGRLLLGVEVNFFDPR